MTKFNFSPCRIACIAALFFLVAPVATEAQQQIVSTTISTMILDDSITSLQWVGDDENAIEGKGFARLYAVSGARSRQVDVPFGSPSRPFNYSGSREITFYHEPISPDPNAPKPTVAARVRLPQDSDEVLLVFVTEDFDKQLFRVLPVDLSASDVEPGTLKITNMAGQPLAWNVADERGLLRPSSSVVVPLDLEVVRVRIQLAQYDDDADRWRRAFNRLFRPHDGERYECLVLPRPGSGGRTLLVRFITDTIETRQAINERGGRELPIDEPPMPEEVDDAQLDETQFE